MSLSQSKFWYSNNCLHFHCLYSIQYCTCTKTWHLRCSTHKYQTWKETFIVVKQLKIFYNIGLLSTALRCNRWCLGVYTIKHFTAVINSLEQLVSLSPYPNIYANESIYNKCTNLLRHRINGRARIRHQYTKTTVLSCHRCLFIPGVEKMNNI